MSDFMKSLEGVDQFYPSEAEQEKIIAFIMESVEKGFDWYLEARPKNWGTLVLKFFMLPKTELHKEFREKIAVPDRARSIKVKTAEVQRDIDYAIKDMHDYNPEENWRYERMNRFQTTQNEYVRIGMSEVTDKGKVKRNKVMVISKEQTPALYFKFM